MKRTDECKRIMVWLAMAVGLLLCGKANADFTFGEPENLGPTINTSATEFLDCISSDGLVMYLTSLERPGGYGGWDLWVSTRETLDEDWAVPVNPGSPLNTAQGELYAYLPADGLELYFSSNRSGGYGNYDLWMAGRSSRDADWDAPENLGPVINSSAVEAGPWLSPDGLELYYYIRTREGGYGDDDIWVSRRSTLDSVWGAPVNLGPVINSSASERLPVVSSNGLLLVFADDTFLRPGGFGDGDLWMARRWNVSDPWNPPLNLGPIVNTSYREAIPRLSPDDSMIYFNSEKPGGFGGWYGDIYQAPIIPIVDFNGDGRVDDYELSKLADAWGQHELSCDVGPTPLGDGVVDVNDLIVLTQYIDKVIDDPTLMAHWALDENEGNIAYDSAGENHAIIAGDVMWLPVDGIVNGALLLDGNTSYCATKSVHDPSEGLLSVFVWVQGGAPGQVIVSQVAAVPWLMADEVSGALKTGFKGSGRGAKPLVSEAVITDGLWHRVGFVWDGTHRNLYVDDVLVAADSQSQLGGSGGGLHIGCDEDLTPGTFWAGMIDEVRIYNRAIAP